MDIRSLIFIESKPILGDKVDYYKDIQSDKFYAMSLIRYYFGEHILIYECGAR